MHTDFKTEMLQNITSNFTIIQWETTLTKAVEKYKGWKMSPQWRLVCGFGYFHENGNDVYDEKDGNMWNRLYGIGYKAVITTAHLMALLFYCNYSKQQYEFTATFRRIYWNETDDSLKKRHSQFHWWARLLRECVECFGTTMQFVDERVFYHGISKQMLFDSTYFHVYGPMSTTVELSVACTFAGMGIVVDLLNKKNALPLFDCEYWSDFANEYERLFIGSLQPFTFETIHHLVLKQNYKNHVRAIGILMKVIQGWPYQISAIKQSDVQCISDLINAHINGQHSPFIPLYIHQLFENIAQKTKEVQMNLRLMNFDNEYADEG